MIVEKAYAKINLTLNVLNKKANNYHNLKSVMIPINLFDELSFKKANTFSINSNIEDNIIIKVFDIFKKRYNISNVEINLVKNIPTQAGLGGGSADATATIRGLNKLFELNLSIKEQEEIAIEVGSDTLFTLHNKPAIVTSTGDNIEFIDINPDFFILLIKPEIGISTKEAFSNIKNFNPKHNDEIINALKENDIKEINKYCYNSFLESIRENKEFNNIYNDIAKDNLVHLSGSGSTLYIIDEFDKLINIEKKYNAFYTKVISTKLQ